MLKKIVTTLKNNYIYVTHVLISVILPIIWIRGGYLYVPEESFFANYKNIADKYLFSWSDKINFGQPVAHWDHSLIMPNGLISWLLNHFGVSAHFSQIIYLTICLLLLLCSISYSLKVFTKNRLTILIVSYLYFFNFYTLFSIGYTGKIYQLILTPLFFAFLYNYLTTYKSKYILFNFLSLFFLQAIFTNLPQFIVALIGYILAIIMVLCKEKNISFTILRNNIWKLICFFLPILPIVMYHALVVYFSLIFTNLNSMESNTAFSALSSPLSYIFQMRGSWWDSQSFMEVPYNHLLSFYNSPYIMVTFFVVILIIFLPFTGFGRERKPLLLYTMLLVSILLSCGSSFMPGIYRVMYDHIPGFYMFREPWAKFMPLTIFLIAMLLGYILNFRKEKWIKGILIVIVVLQGIPFFTGKVIDYSDKAWKKVVVNLPQYWLDFEDWSQKNKNVHILPYQYLSDNTYKWYPGDFGNSNVLMYNLFGESNLVGLSQKYSSLNNFGNVMSCFKTGRFVELGNIDYLLVQKDVADDPKIHIPKDLWNYFEEDASINFGKKLFLYPMKTEYRLPHVFVPDNVKDLASECLENDMTERSNRTIYIKSDSSALLPKTYNHPKVEYKKNSPVKYQVDLKGAEGKVLLFFGESFNRAWKIYPVPRSGESYLSRMRNIFRKTDVSTLHIEANGYANTWLLDIDEICNNNKSSCIKSKQGYNLTVQVIYWPQRLFSFMVLCQLATLIVCLLIVLIPKLKLTGKLKKGLSVTNFLRGG